MTRSIPRRTLLAAALAAGGAAVARRLPAAPGPAPLTLTAGVRTLEVNGKAARVFGLVDGNGKPGLTLDPGQRFTVDLVNDAGTETIVHWHGQVPQWTQDGFPWEQTPFIPAGGRQRYDYQPIAGTFWMHSHRALQEQELMAAPLIVRSAAELREDRQEVVLLLHDFTFTSPEELFEALKRAPNLNQESMPGMAPGASMDMGSPMKMGSADAMQMGSGAGPDLTDIRYDAYLANDRTLADPEVVRVERSGRVRLRVINAAAATQFWLDLGELSGAVVAVDGHPVRPVAGSRFPISMAQRLDILLDLPAGGAFPVLARVEGLRSWTGIVLAAGSAPIRRLPDRAEADAPPADMSLEGRLAAVAPLAPRAADVTHRMVMGGSMQPYKWSLNGQYWPDVTPLMISEGQRVMVDIVNETSMAHPMHLHGHVFQVVGINGAALPGAMRDTVMVPANGRVAIAFDADNPGRWAFHCHNLFHMESGMVTEFRYPGIV